MKTSSKKRRLKKWRRKEGVWEGQFWCCLELLRNYENPHFLFSVGPLAPRALRVKAGLCTSNCLLLISSSSALSFPLSLSLFLLTLLATTPAITDQTVRYWGITPLSGDIGDYTLHTTHTGGLDKLASYFTEPRNLCNTITYLINLI